MPLTSTIVRAMAMDRLFVHDLKEYV